MAHPRSRFLFPFLLLLGTGSIYAQGPIQTREPPLADAVVEPAHARGVFDQDEPIERVQHTVPADRMPPPGKLPADLLPNPGIVPAQFTQVISPAGELPTPIVTLNIEGSEAAPTGQAVIYKLHVRNQSRAKAHNVIVRVTPPKNATKVKADPPATTDEAETRWELKSLDPGQLRTIEIVYKPNSPDVEEVKVLARVQYDFGRGMITRIAAPTLSVKREGPEKMVVGDTGTFRITVSNTGKVTVRDIEVKEFLNKGLVYEDRELSRGSVDGRLMSSIDPKTGERMWSIAALAPGQSRVLEYRVKARDPGTIGCTVLVKAGTIQKETGGDTEVLTANLQLKAEGPQSGKGTVGQAAGYRVVVENKGSADLRNVAVRCTFPPDMRPTRATSGGQPFRDSVQWILRELKKGDVKELNVGLTTSSPGTRTVQFTARADRGPEQRDSVRTEFAGIPTLGWDTDVPGTVSVGRSMVYRVTVSNTGTSAARQTQLRVDLPAQVEFVGSMPEAGRGTGQNANEVIFAPYTIPAGKKTTYRIEVRARAAGEARVVFRLSGEGVGSEPAEHRKSTNVTPTADNRSPTGPPPRPDPSRAGSSPRD